MLELWETRSTLSLPLLSGSLRPEMVAPDRVPSLDQIELFDIQTECKKNDLCKIDWLEI